MPSLVYSHPSNTRDHSKKAPFLPRKLEACNDVELNPGPKSPTKKQSKGPSMSFYPDLISIL